MGVASDMGLGLCYGVRASVVALIMGRSFFQGPLSWPSWEGASSRASVMALIMGRSFFQGPLPWP